MDVFAFFTILMPTVGAMFSSPVTIPCSYSIVGTLPPGFNDLLQPHGSSVFLQGPCVTTCQPTPSLSTIPTTSAPPSTSQCPTSLSTITVTDSIMITKTSTVTESAAARGNGTCIGRTGSGTMLASGFCCHYAYCPVHLHPIYGKPIPTPPSGGVYGIPLRGEDDSSHTSVCVAFPATTATVH